VILSPPCAIAACHHGGVADALVAARAVEAALGSGPWPVAS
jgi:hypothetical protein